MSWFCSVCEKSFSRKDSMQRQVMNKHRNAGLTPFQTVLLFGTITTIFVLYAITRSRKREITPKGAFFGVTIVEQLRGERERGLIHFHPLQMAVFPLFVNVFNKGF